MGERSMINPNAPTSDQITEAQAKLQRLLDPQKAAARADAKRQDEYGLRSAEPTTTSEPTPVEPDDQTPAGRAEAAIRRRRQRRMEAKGQEEAVTPEKWLTSIKEDEEVTAGDAEYIGATLDPTLWVECRRRRTVAYQDNGITRDLFDGTVEVTYRRRKPEDGDAPFIWLESRLPNQIQPAKPSPEGRDRWGSNVINHRSEWTDQRRYQVGVKGSFEAPREERRNWLSRWCHRG
jgi:hypothetical protein